MRPRKTPDTLNEAEWAVLHAVQDCKRYGRKWTGRDFYRFVPGLNPETARRLRNALVADGLLERARPAPARPTPDPAPPTPGEIAAIGKKPENHVNTIYPDYVEMIPDIIDDMSEPLLDNISPCDACRIIMKRWAMAFGDCEGVI